jgi:hypothetical protein
MSMMPTVLLIIGATAMGGVLKESGAPEAAGQGSPSAREERQGGLVVSVISACYLTLLASGNQMLAIILPGQGLQRRLSRRGASIQRCCRELWRTRGPWAPRWSRGAQRRCSSTVCSKSACYRICPIRLCELAGSHRGDRGTRSQGVFLWKEHNETSKEDVN